jgi:hypothetical protein
VGPRAGLNSVEKRKNTLFLNCLEIKILDSIKSSSINKGHIQ